MTNGAVMQDDLIAGKAAALTRNRNGHCDGDLGAVA
jgi:hypothetical protein